MLKVISICFLISFFVSKQAVGEELTVAAGDWPPYLSKELKHNGIIGHLLSDIFKEAGYEIKITFYPWPRAYSLAKTNKQNMTAVWMRKHEREEDFHYSDPVLNEQFVFFHLKKTHFDWSTLEDLHGLVIGGGNEYSYGAEFDKALNVGNINIERVPTKYQNWQKLLLGRISIHPEELNVGYSSLKQHYTQDVLSLITHHPKPFLNNLSYLLFPKSTDKSLQLMAAFNKHLKLFRENGRYDEYFKAFQDGYYSEK